MGTSLTESRPSPLSAFFLRVAILLSKEYNLLLVRHTVETVMLPENVVRWEE
jgi:hypothetical protein